MSQEPTIHWSPAAEALFRLDRPTAVSAGAGSGKTTALVELCLRLLSGEATGRAHDPSEIVAITFTEKAAEELTERLREALAARARTADVAQRGAWLTRLRELDRMMVGTIHGFAGRLLREHALEAGIDPEYTVLDEEAAAALRQAAAQTAVLAAVDSGRSTALELCAGYGAAGERGGLTAVVAEIVRERSTLGHSMPLTPCPVDPEAAVRTRERLLELTAALLAQKPGPSTPSGRKALATLSSVFEGLSSEDREGPIGLATATRLQALAEAVRPWRVGKADGPQLSSLRGDLVAAAEALLPLVAEVLGEPQRCELCALVADAEARYAGAKEARSALDFDDLLIRVRDLLLHNQLLRFDLRQRVRALLVDEYQDVNRLQQEIFELLKGIEPGAEGSTAPIFVAVGDLKQSIYRFRGADVAVFSGLLERFNSGGEGRVLHLCENHRSTPAAIELVNAIFERCMQPVGSPRPYEIHFTEADRLIPTRHGGLAPAAEVLEDVGDGNAAERRDREARAIAGRIQSLVAGVAGVSISEREPDGSERIRTPRYGDLALLFRRLTQIGGYERALREAGIPYRLARGGGFYQAPEIRDLGELLVSLFEPDDAMAWAALLRSPLCSVSEGTLFLLSQRGLGTWWRRSSEEVAEVVKNGWAKSGEVDSVEAELSRLERFRREWGALHARRDRLMVNELLEQAMERLDFEPALLAGPEGERRAENLRKALSLAQRFSEAGGGAASFGERLRRLAAQPPREPEAALETEDTVAILSVHQAKGLEWPVVLVPDLAARRPNDSRRVLLDDQSRLCADWFDLTREEFLRSTALRAAREERGRAAVAESRRLLYVALTRARDYLILSGMAGASREESWADIISQIVKVRPQLVRCVSAETIREVTAAEPAPPAEATVVQRLERQRLLTPPVARVVVQMAVTELAEYARCPRRHWLSGIFGLSEPDLVTASGSSSDDPARATARGILAHALLSESDLAAPPRERHAQFVASATRRGFDPRSDAVRYILADISRFLDSPAGCRLAALSRRGALQWEMPFLIKFEPTGPYSSTRADPPACYLSGTVDALAEEGRELTVIDFKYSFPRPQAATRYRAQLLAYALAVARAQPGRPVRVILQFLRGRCGAIDVTPTPGALADFEAAVPALVRDASRGEGERHTAADLGRDEARCRAEGCRYTDRCYHTRTRPAAPGRSLGG